MTHDEPTTTPLGIRRAGRPEHTPTSELVEVDRGQGGDVVLRLEDGEEIHVHGQELVDHVKELGRAA